MQNDECRMQNEETEMQKQFLNDGCPLVFILHSAFIILHLFPGKP